MSPLTGAKLGPYEIVAPIGAGGMGEVYRARDPRLGRDVAIKVSHERFSKRFEREARAIAGISRELVVSEMRSRMWRSSRYRSRVES
jgi:serine/threonine protein kinase